MKEHREVQVVSCTFQDLLDAHLTDTAIPNSEIKGKLHILEYQRPYVWTEKQVNRLLKDLQGYQQWDNERKPLYYLGSIILHQDGAQLKIIDGQQRITTLLMMKKLQEDDFRSNINYNSSISIRNIKKNLSYLKTIQNQSIYEFRHCKSIEHVWMEPTGRLLEFQINTDRDTTMNKYKNLHLWMLIPFVIMQAGIFPFYWPTFSQEYWGVHVHYWLATVWYVFLITQPYLATHGKLERHRTNGIIGFFIAGGVVFSAISMLMGDMRNAGMIEQNPSSSNLTPEFLYGVVVIELILTAAFIYSIIQAIIKRKNLEEHAWWLVAGLFYIMMPAVGRGFFFAIAVLNGGLYEVPLFVPNNIATGVIITLLLLFAWKYKKLKHQATWIGVAINLTVLFHKAIGSSQGVQEALKSMILYRP